MKKNRPNKSGRRLLKRKKPPKTKYFKTNLTKRAVASLPHPGKGDWVQRYIHLDTRTPHFRLRITRTSKTFYWEATREGEQRRVTIGRFPAINPEQARARAADIAADYVKGTDVQANRRAKRDELTFGELWADYRENRPRRTHAQKKAGVYSRNLDEQWERVLKKWENKKLSKITKAKASKLVKGMRKRAPIYANRIQAHGRGMFNFAIAEWEWRGENPFLFKMVSEEGRERSLKKNTRVHDIPKFIDSLSVCSDDMRLLFLCTLRTGRRITEVKRMRWEDLDLEAAPALWFPDTKIGPQKTWLPVEIVDELKERQKKIDGEWVFPSSSKSGHIEEIKKAWEQVREALGVRELQARDLRRSFISWAQEEGVPIAAVQKQVGHKRLETTAKHYTTFSDTAQSNWVNAANARMTKAAK